MTQKTMRAMLLTGHGGLDKLKYDDDYPRPVAGAGEVLIRVSACGLNNTDVNTRTAWYSQAGGDAGDAAWGGSALEFPRIQGADVCGVVAAVGDGVGAELIGKRVLIDPWLRDWNAPDDQSKCGYFGSECDGGFAEFCVADYRNVHAIESALSDAELATFATASVTAENMLARAQVGDGDEVLISGASGGVGSALLQLCRRRGATTIALCAEAKAEQVREVGADVVVTYADIAELDLAAALRKHGRESVSVVADLVGGAIWSQLIGVLSRGGRYVCAGAIGGAMVNFDLRIFYLRNLTLVGATTTPPNLFADLTGYIARKEIKPTLAKTYPLAKLHDAQQAFIDKKHIGNIVVTMEHA